MSRIGRARTPSVKQKWRRPIRDETIVVDMALARRAAAVRARTKLKLPDAYALATAIHAEHDGHDDVRLETFDKKVVKAYADLHPLSPDPS